MNKEPPVVVGTQILLNLTIYTRITAYNHLILDGSALHLSFPILA